MDIRPGHSGDQEAILGLLRDAALPIDDLSVAPVRFLIGFESGEPVGVVGLEGQGGSALLRSLAVAAPYRSRAFGQQLLRAVEHDAVERGVKALFLLTTTAAPFFLARGFVPVSRADVPPEVQRSAEFSALCPASAICLRKTLPLRIP